MTEITKPYGLIYGREGYDYPSIAESGPYATAAEARAAINPARLDHFGGVMVVSGYRASDGVSITTGAGMVVDVVDVQR